jgi:hypothetical protein
MLALAIFLFKESEGLTNKTVCLLFEFFSKYWLYHCHEGNYNHAESANLS